MKERIARSSIGRDFRDMIRPYGHKREQIDPRMLSGRCGPDRYHGGVRQAMDIRRQHSDVW